MKIKININTKYTVTIASTLSYINEDGEFRAYKNTATHHNIDGRNLMEWIVKEIQDTDTSEIEIRDEIECEIKFTKFNPHTGELGTIWYLIGVEE